VGGVRAACGEAAALVPAGDPAALAAALCTLFDDPTLAATRVRAGRVLAKSHDWDAVGRRLEDVLVGLTSR
jgi:glycosyltransferase involved in cell wall biosynthesis